MNSDWKVVLGIDVAKATFDVCEWPANTVCSVPNTVLAIREWLAKYPDPKCCLVVLEATDGVWFVQTRGVTSGIDSTGSNVLKASYWSPR